jgi:hypothetical protein
MVPLYVRSPVAVRKYDSSIRDFRSYFSYRPPPWINVRKVRNGCPVAEITGLLLAARLPAMLKHLASE